MAYQANRRNNTDPERAAKDQRNAEAVKKVADVAQHSANPYAKAAGTAVKVGDKLTRGKVSNSLGKAMRNSPAERIMNLGSGQNKDSKLKEMLQRNSIRKNTNKQNNNSEENVKNNGGEQNSSPSSDSKKEDKNNNKKSGNKSKTSDETSKPREEKKDSSGLSELKARIRRMRIILAIAGILSGFLIIIVIVVAVVSSVLGMFAGFEDAIGVSSNTGRSTGNVAYASGSKEQQEFYERVNDVELDFLSKGQQIDSLKVVAVYHVLKENGAQISYGTMTESRIRDIANSMLNGGVYDESTFKSNLINKVIPQYLPTASKKQREAMADSVLKYVTDYYEFIGEEPVTSYTSCTSAGSCSYDIKGYYIKGKGNVSENIKVSNLYVRLMQCGTANGHNYGGTFGKPLAGEDLVPFETYILGVAYQEIGASAPAEAVKAQMVAARSYILARHADMGGWRTLKQENDKWVLQAAACTQDQVFCNPDKGCSGTNGQWGQVYSGTGHGSFSKGALSQSSPLRTYSSQTSGEVLTNKSGYIIYSGYTQTEQTKMTSLAKQGLNYKQILMQIYNQGSRNYGAANVVKANCSSGTMANCGTTSTGAFASWKQAGQSWSNVRMGNSGRTIGQIGCLVTSISMLIAKSGVQTNIPNFNPGTFVQFLNNNGGFDGYGNLSYAPISKAAPAFKWTNQVDLTGMSKEQKLSTISKYASQGYYMTAEVATSGQHWVAIDSVSGNRINIMDPATNITDLWGSGKYTPSSTKTLNLFKVG